MKLTVNKNLNARLEKPSVNSSNPFYRAPGFTLKIDDVMPGDEIDGNSIWYHSKDDGCYYWSGGFSEVEFIINKFDIDTVSKELRNSILAQAKQYYLFKFQNTVGFTGISIADKLINNKKSNHISLSFQVLQKTKNAEALIPESLHFKGFILLTDIVEAQIAELQVSYPGTDNPRKISGSISRKDINEWGSCGIKVEGLTKENHGTYVLTNYHVAAPDLLLNKQYMYWMGNDTQFKECVMPSWNYQKKESNIIGYLYRGLFDNWHDVALIKLYDPGRVTNYTPGNEIPVSGLDIFNDESFHGSKVTMYSSNTGRRETYIISTNSSQVFLIHGRKLTKENLIQVKKISQKGDSGSPIFLNGQVVGLLIGADDSYSYILPIQRILNHFQLKLS